MAKDSHNSPPSGGGGAVYDYIIAGAGCAGLSLAVHMINSGRFGNKRILIVDQEEKIKNDRTWCFWEKEPGLFEDIVYTRWNKVWFYGNQFSQLLKLLPYQYKLVRGIDFYTYCLDLIARHDNISFQRGEVEGFTSTSKGTSIVVNGQSLEADYIFNSILFEKPVLKKNEYWLLQHFKGWVIETQGPVFNPSEAVLMDFRVEQTHGTSFVYVMPFSPTTALVEFTLFTKELLQPQQYDEELSRYIRQVLRINSFRVTDEEFGVIPMTNHQFATRDNNIINIGTAGGQTKASSGYTFHFIQMHSAAIVKQLGQTGKFLLPSFKKRFHFYDSTLLDILYHNSFSGKEIFSVLFKKNKPQRVLRFLDNESSIKDELSIISSLPTLPFLKAALKHL